MRKVLLYFAFLFTLVVHGQDVRLPLWPEGKIPHRIPSDETERMDSTDILRISKVQIPEMDVYLPEAEKATGQAVVLLPGGGYHILAYHWEGTNFAKWFRDRGIAAIVLKYRLPTSRSLSERHWAPLSDAQRAIRICRDQADAWGLDPGQIGVMGFSAGGHLAATLSTQYRARVYEPVDTLDSLSARPSYSILVYPVISFTDPAVHSGSKTALLGEEPRDSLLRFFSPEQQTDAETPKAFLIHAADDTGVPVENSLLYYNALRAHGVPASLHLFPEGGHGFAFASDHPYLKAWTEILLSWMSSLRKD